MDVISTPIARQKAKTGPIILNTKARLTILIAGPAYRNVKAGPIPHPLLSMLVKRGTILQEHVGRIWPATDAIGMESHLLDFGPKNFVIEYEGTKVAMAPARRKAGNTVVTAPHVKTQQRKISTISISF